ncbi:hypothetical protein FF1_024176 [Malus domestica]
MRIPLVCEKAKLEGGFDGGAQSDKNELLEIESKALARSSCLYPERSSGKAKSVRRHPKEPTQKIRKQDDMKENKDDPNMKDAELMLRRHVPDCYQPNPPTPSHYTRGPDEHSFQAMGRP